MNLIECLAVGDDNETDPADANFTQCMSTWLIKTHTNFLDTDLYLPWYFGLLCWSYAVGGIMMFVTQPKWTKHSSFPYVGMAWLLILVQAPLSFAADYLSMTHDSYIHTADRLLACPLMVLELSKIATMFPHVRIGSFVLYLTSALAAICSFIKSSEAQDMHDQNGFIFWHNCWHLYPLAVSVITIYDYFVLGEYDRQAVAGGGGAAAVDAKTPRPLSSVVMASSPITAAASSTPRRSARLRYRTNAIAASS